MALWTFDSTHEKKTSKVKYAVHLKKISIITTKYLKKVQRKVKTDKI